MNSTLIRKSKKLTLILILKAFIQVAYILLLTKVLNVEIYGSYIALATLGFLLGVITSSASTYYFFENGDYFKFKRVSIILNLSLFILYMLIAQILLGTQGVTYLAMIGIGIVEVLFFPIIVIFGNYIYVKNGVLIGQGMLLIPYLIKVISCLVIHFSLLNLWLPPIESLVLLQFLLSFLIVFFIFYKFKPLDSVESVEPLSHITNNGLTHAHAIASSDVDKVIAVNIVNNADASAYSLASRIIHTTLLPIVALVTSISPILYGNKKSLYSFFPKAILLSVCWAVSAFFLLRVFIPVFELVLPLEFHEVLEILPLFSIICFTVTLKYLLFSFVMLIGVPFWRLKIELIGIVILIALLSLKLVEHNTSGLVYAVFFSDLVVVNITLISMLYFKKKIVNVERG